MLIWLRNPVRQAYVFGLFGLLLTMYSYAEPGLAEPGSGVVAAPAESSLVAGEGALQRPAESDPVLPSATPVPLLAPLSDTDSLPVQSDTGLRLKEAANDGSQPMSGQSVIEMLGGLVAVLALFVALVWGMRQLQGRIGGQTTRMRVEATLALGTREKLLIVTVDEQRLLLGVTPHQINCLRVLPGSAAASSEAGDFAGRLQSLLSSEAKDV